MAKKHPQFLLIHKLTFGKAKVLRKVIRMTIMGTQIAAEINTIYGVSGEDLNIETKDKPREYFVFEETRINLKNQV